MNLPNTPKGWAGRLSKIYRTVHGIECFPIDVRGLALEYPKQIFPDEPITKIEGGSFSTEFEGALIPGKNEWLIIYNQGTENAGRLNFTVAHEFGHYLLHRRDILEPKQCKRSDMTNWQLEGRKIEAEANIFAANLLMPSADFCKQIYKQGISIELLRRLANRYQVSLTALALRLIHFLKQPAMLVSGKDGFIDWACSNSRLMKLNIFYQTRGNIIEIPKESLAISSEQNGAKTTHNENVWIGIGKVEEILVYKTDEVSLSLLLYDSKIDRIL